MKELCAEIRNANICMNQIMKDKKNNEVQKLARLLIELNRQTEALWRLAKEHKL